MRLRPLTERVLLHLPGPPALWIAAWAAVPWLNAGANLLRDSESRSAIWEQGTTLVVLNYAALSLAVVTTLWGAARIARRVEALPATTGDVLAVEPERHFRGVDDVGGPLLAAAATAVAFGVTAFVADGWTAGLLRGATWLVVGVPIWSYLWTYGSLQLGLDRLGRQRLRPDAIRADPTLNLRPLGDLAFMGLWMLLAWLVPLVLTGLPDVVGVVLGLGVLVLALATFVLSLLRLHRRMVEVKANELALARDLYSRAYDPLRAERTLEALERQHPLLGAADALEKRAQAIHEWPVHEGTVTRVITITTSVTAITTARLILGPLGLCCPRWHPIDSRIRVCHNSES